MNGEVSLANGQSASLQLVQDVYHSLTGKTETVNSFWFDKHDVDISDFEQLHRIIEQTIEPHDCISSNLAISVKYCGEKNERFSSLERFRSQATERNAPTEEVEFEYDFLIRLPQTEEPRPYRVVVGLRSIRAIESGMRMRGASEAEQDIFRKFGKATGRFELHYIDIAVARSLEAALVDWYGSLSKKKNGHFALVLNKLSDASSIAVRVLAVVATIIFSFLLSVRGIASERELLVAAVKILSASWAVSLITIPISSNIRRMLERLGETSMICLGRGDRRLRESQKSQVVRSIGKLLAALVIGVLVALISSYISSLLGF